MMKEVVLEVDVVNSDAVALAVLKKISRTGAIIKGYKAVVNDVNDEYAIVSVIVVATTKKVHHIKKLLESYEEIVDVSVNEEKSCIQYYKSCNS